VGLEDKASSLACPPGQQPDQMLTQASEDLAMATFKTSRISLVNREKFAENQIRVKNSLR
jgi:hypothetical protein